MHNEKPPQHQQNNLKYMTIPPTSFPPPMTKKQKGEGRNTKQNPVQLGFLFIDVPLTFPPQFQSLPSTPKKGSERKGLLGF